MIRNHNSCHLTYEADILVSLVPQVFQISYTSCLDRELVRKKGVCDG
jgi:hypothetical protein